MKRKLRIVPLVLMTIALVCLVVSFFLAGNIYTLLHVEFDRFVFTFTLLAIFSTLVIIFTTIYDDEKPLVMNIYFPVLTLFIVYSILKVVFASIGSITIYFTVNMGDMSLYQSIFMDCVISCVLYFVSLLLIIVSSFMKNKKEVKVTEVEEEAK